MPVGTMNAAQQMNKLAAEVDSVFIRNTQPNVAVYSNPNLGIDVVFAAKGDPTGQDMQEIAGSALKDPNFRSTLLRGILEIVEGQDDISAAIDRLRGNWNSDNADRADITAKLNRHADRVIARAATCIVPKGRDLCGSIAADGNPDKPPLCSEHMQLANQYVQEPGMNGALTWRRRG